MINQSLRNRQYRRSLMDWANLFNDFKKPCSLLGFSLQTACSLSHKREYVIRRFINVKRHAFYVQKVKTAEQTTPEISMKMTDYMSKSHGCFTRDSAMDVASSRGVSSHLPCTCPLCSTFFLYHLMNIQLRFHL